MPERDEPRYLPQGTMIWARFLGMLLLIFVVSTELRPTGWELSSVELSCARTVNLYAAAVMAYREQKGRLPHNLDQLVPLYLPEHHPCDGSFTGSEPRTRLGLQQRMRQALSPLPEPQTPDYSVVGRPDGTHTFEIVCNRRHGGRHGYRGDRGRFTLRQP